MPGQLTPKGEISRQAILAAAYPLFLEKGYHGTSSRDIARGAGLTVGGVYAHFTGKEDIFIDVLRVYNLFRQVIPAIASAQGETTQALVTAMAQAMLAALAHQPQALNLMFIELVEFQGRHFALLFPEVFPAMGAAMAQITIDPQDLRPISPLTLIRSFFGFFFSFYMTSAIFTHQLPSDDETLSEFTDIYLHGILADPQLTHISPAVTLQPNDPPDQSQPV